MQEPSPGNGKIVTTGLPSSIADFRESGIAMIGQCMDVSEAALASGSQNMVLQNQNVPPNDPQTQAQFEADKRAVYKHPLFPLLALLFEKCELATQSAEVSSSESFNMDIQAFVQHQERDRKPFFSDDPDVDSLMVKAIQVLRIHLLELEKVQELCKDFCNRYIACLKNKMQSENLLRPDYPGLGNNIPSSGSSTPSSGGSSSQPLPVPGSNGTINNYVIQSPNPMPVNNNNIQNQIVSGGSLYQMVQTPQGIMAQPIQVSPNSNAHIVHGSTPLSQIGASSIPHDNRMPPIAPRPLIPSGDDDDDDIMSKKKQKRGVLPKHATSIMRSWLFQHIVHPYPTEDEKKQIAHQTNLTLLQVNNWFINARRRILQPMLDASNPESNHKSKKSKTQSNRPVQRFWPENIASIQPQVQNPDSEGSPSDENNQLTNPGDPQASTSGMNINQHMNHYAGGSSTTPDTGHSSPDGNISQNCSDVDANKVPSIGSLDDLSMSCNTSTDEENDDDDKR
ncbi:homeobox protein PKNOX1 [Parasteatoda tepidariorum]|uniref:homeobox protein PKNOX1 n=1 Tax=Parasteatoda tepidariorum TaxID=114398 RepID=UPI00077FBBB7|nr:homeobox protein PKNOX1 [Parasteatoda tepidariorum]XP_015927311.1 homeobox protein PKNOX1 [Parasteatoda tepidariorum]XP_042896069.1 homeobox protein PKNOX1 [Parasteatoda tepidariorum]